MAAKVSISSERKVRTLQRLWLANFSRFGGQTWPQKCRFRLKSGCKSVDFVSAEGQEIAATLAGQFQPFWWPDLAAKVSISSERKVRRLQRLWVANFSRFGGQTWPQKCRFRLKSGCKSGDLVSAEGQDIAATLAGQFQPF